MKNIALILCMLVITIANAQKKAPAKQKTESKKDWDALDITFAGLIKAIEKNDKPAFMANSLKQIDCQDCKGKPDFNEQGSAVTADVFYTDISKNFSTSPVYQAIIKKGYTFSIAVIKDFHPKYLPKDYPKDLKLYEVWVPTYLKNELSKGHPGTSHAFQFIKINGQFKFYGLVSIP